MAIDTSFEKLSPGKKIVCFFSLYDLLTDCQARTRISVVHPLVKM